MSDYLAVPVSHSDHALGVADAPVTLVEYGDFECPFCGRSYPAVKALRLFYGEQLQGLWEYFM